MSQEVKTTAVLAVPPERAWEVLMSPARLPDWVSAHQELRWDGAELGVGSSFGQTLKLNGVKVRIEWTVAAAERPRFAAWEGRGPGGSTARVTYALEPAAAGTRFHYTNYFEFPGGAIGRTAARIASAAKGRKEAERSLETLKALLDSEAVAPDQRPIWRRAVDGAGGQALAAARRLPGVSRIGALERLLRRD